MKYFAIFLIIIGFVGTAYAIHDDQTSRGVDDPKITVSDSGVYVVWGEGSGQNSLDLIFAKSADGGKTFGKTINLTNGMSFFPDPYITVSENNVYVVWEDSISQDGIDSIFFTKSNDGGQTFDEPRVLDPVDDSYNLIYRPIEIIESNDVLYVFASYWERETKQHQMIFLTSSDNGDTFSSPTVLFDDGQWDDYIDFEVNNGIIYVLTDDKKNYDELGDLNLRKIFADGSPSDIISVNGGDTAASTAQLATSDENVYVAWRAWENDRWNLAFAKSSDSGDTFAEPQILNSDPTSVDIHSSEGSNIFAYGDSVYVKWHEVYWDGENQSFKTWTATSHDSGQDFDVEVHPLDKFLSQYGMILSVQEGENLYSMAMTTKNPPFDDGAIYFARSNDGKSYTEPVDVLKNNPPEFRLPDITTHGNSIHMVAEGNRESSCIMYASSYNNGVSFEMKNISPNGNPKQCLGIEEQIPAPLHQMSSGIDIEDIQCKDDRLKGYVLALREDNRPVCVTAASYDTMLERSIISDESFDIMALNAARDYVLSHPKISSTIIDDSLELDVYMTRHSIPPAFVIKGSFETTNPIYDDDTDPLNHSIDITLVQYNKIHSAQLDDKHELTEYDASSENRNPRVKTIVSPTVKTILSPGDRVNNNGLIPLIITEVSQGGFDQTTHWTFQSIGYQADNKNKMWGFLPDQHRVHETVDEKGDDAIDRDRMPENFGVPLPLFIFPLLCGDERIEGESGWHYTLPTRTDTSMVYFRSTDKGIYPDENGIYDIQFVSMFKTEVELKPNFEVLSEQSVLCPMESTSNDATHAYYTRLQFKIDDKISESYQSPDSADSQIHERATILVRIFGDKFSFDSSEFYLQNPQINIEPAEPNMIHRNSDDATLEFFFDTMGMKITAECFIFPDGREFCNNDEYSLKFYVNNEKTDDISQYLINDDDRVLISYGSKTEQDLSKQLDELESLAKYNYQTLEKLMTMDVGTVADGTFDSDLGFRTAEKIFRIDMERQTAKHDLEYALSQKQSAYDTMIRQDADQKALESIQDEIKQIESQLNQLNNTANQYTTEDIFQRVDQIEAENILMHKIGPEEYDKLVSAKNTFEEQAKGESISIASVQINPDTARLDVILSKDMEGDTATIDHYKSVIDDIMPQDTPWTMVFSD